MTKPTLSVEFEIVEGGGSYTTFDSDVRYPISLQYGMFSYTPTAPYVAAGGSMTFYYDNYAATLPYTEASSDGNVRGKGLGTKYRLKCTHDTDRIVFEGRAVEWNVVPGFVEERVTEVVCADYISEMGRYPVDDVSPQLNVTAEDLMLLLASEEPFPGDAMPHSPSSYSYSSNGETFAYAFHDLSDGGTSVLSAASKIAASEMGHVYAEGGTLYYKTHDDFINLGTNIGTLNNTWSELEVSKNRSLEYAPIYVSYTPVAVSDSNEVLVALQDDYVVKTGATETVRLSYRDPDNKDIQVSVLDTDIVTPVLNTDYVISGAASSDCTVTFTNMGSAGEYEIAVTGDVDATFTTLQVRGKPIYIYDQATIVSPAGNPSAVALRKTLPYSQRQGNAKSISGFLARKYSTYPTNNTARNISFMATADSDQMQLAMLGEIGKTFTLVEDVNVINEDYVITSVAWDIYGPEEILVTWGIYPQNRVANVWVDEDGDILVDSNGVKFASWR